jgi:hypothetical protein
LKRIHLSDEFNKFIEKIQNGENFALMRNADGELAIMEGRSVSAQEGNWVSPNYVSNLGKAIFESLQLKADNVYYAISCPCCDKRAYYWYMSRVADRNNVTFANIWINANYNRFKEEFPKIKRDAVLIANFRAESHKIGNLNILKHYKISDDCISFWDKEAPNMLNEIKKEYGDKNDILYVVSAGPMSAPIIADLYENNPNNCYVDFGSSIDIYYREGVTRPYMKKGNVYAERNCWMYNPREVSFDVTAVCTLYKRPESLVKQIEALERQSLKPKELLLFQDGIADYYKIEMLDSLKQKFSKIRIADHNMGVWERFNLAREADSQYVCVFDDDTIPGDRWLENCHDNMMNQKGIYGTNGIVMTDEKTYPLGGYFMVGWKGPVKERTEVDFVGHSWFMERQCLEYMFDGTEKFQKIKYAAEDMCLSVKAKEKGIRTFVPPHPNTDKTLWGSTPIFGDRFGNAVEALSFNMNNLKKMQKAIAGFVKEGWKPLCVEDNKKVKIAARNVKREKLNNYYMRGKNLLKRKIL